MSAKKSAEVVIGGKLYTLSGYEEEEYLQKVAGYINNKIAEYNNVDVYVSFLRKKMQYTKTSVTIRLIRGVGYQLEAGEHD